MLLGLSWSTAGADDIHIEQGHRFVTLHCAMCHAVGRLGDSPLPIAPPFRTLHQYYPIDELAESMKQDAFFANHPNMPQFLLDPDQIGDVIAYLRSLGD